MRERRVSSHSLPVNGYNEETRQCFQYLGCLWHSCNFCDTNRNPDGNLKNTSCKKRPHAKIRQETLENKKRLEAEGFTVVEMHDCQ